MNELSNSLSELFISIASTLFAIAWSLLRLFGDYDGTSIQKTMLKITDMIVVASVTLALVSCLLTHQ